MKRICRLGIAAVLMLLLILVGANHFRRAQSTFDGDRVARSDRYYLNFERLNREDSHRLELKEGDRLSVCFAIAGGRGDLTIGIEGEPPIYTANDMGSGDFIVQVPKTGTYVISMTGKRAKGIVSIAVE